MIVINSDKYVTSYWMINGVIECCKLENIQNINQEEKDSLILDYENKEENKNYYKCHDSYYKNNYKSHKSGGSGNKYKKRIIRMI